jgi:hypothetical protein
MLIIDSFKLLVEKIETMQSSSSSQTLFVKDFHIIRALGDYLYSMKSKKSLKKIKKKLKNRI